jgi:poly-gamma-glutamate synthesis protein (capsule biosynthesis protein)
VVVGGHPHVTQGVEMIGVVPVFYSLGNFIFDQPMPETDKGYALGLLREKNNLTFWILPYHIVEKQPTPVTDEEAQMMFEELAGLSSETLFDAMMQGKITITYP